MRAMVRDEYGPPKQVLELREVEKPELSDDGVLVRVRATSVNRSDYYAVTGPFVIARVAEGLRRPKSPLVGSDFAGVVEAVGKDVTDLKPGDEVFGGRTGSFAEYVNSRMGIATKPRNVSFEEAASVPVAALTALQGLRDKGGLQPGQRVLINGASGGVGVYAVQIAKAFGGEVTGVTSTRNVELVGSLGADHVVDYTREDFTRNGRRYDLILDLAATKPWPALARVLEKDATLVMAGATGVHSNNPLVGPLTQLARTRLRAVRSGRKVVFFIAKFNRPDMRTLRDLVESGKVEPVVERRYELEEIPDALAYMGEGHVRSKLVVTV